MASSIEGLKVSRHHPKSVSSSFGRQHTDEEHLYRPHWNRLLWIRGTMIYCR